MLNANCLTTQQCCFQWHVCFVKLASHFLQLVQISSYKDSSSKKYKNCCPQNNDVLLECIATIPSIALGGRVWYVQWKDCFNTSAVLRDSEMLLTARPSYFKVPKWIHCIFKTCSATRHDLFFINIHHCWSCHWKVHFHV